MNILPIVVDKNNNKEVAYDIYSMLLSSRIIFINGEINDTLSGIVISELLYLDSLSNDDIYIYINSPGGSISSGLAIYDTINFIKSKVITIGLGMCASMGAFLLSSGQKRMALPNCEIMIHEPLGGISGNASDIKVVSDHILKIKQKVNKILSKNTKKSIKKIENDTKKDNYMDAKEALEYGIIDEIIHPS